jgi:hypothetical protein
MKQHCIVPSKYELEIKAYNSQPHIIELNFDSALESYASRIENCSSLPWANLKCGSCGKILIKRVAKLSCLSPFCKNPECIKNRVNILLNYFLNLKIRSKSLFHFIIGFPKVHYFTKEKRKHHLKVLRKFSDLMKKRGFPLQAAAVRDIAGKRYDLYVHYHFANLPVKDFRAFSKALKETRDQVKGIIVKIKGYRKFEPVVNYLARRGAGVFGDISKGNTYGYADLMDLKTYYLVFFKSRKIQLYGLKPSAELTNLAIMLDNKITKCPYCNSTNLIFEIEQENNTTKPPP